MYIQYTVCIQYTHLQRYYTCEEDSCYILICEMLRWEREYCGTRFESHVLLFTAPPQFADAILTEAANILHPLPLPLHFSLLATNIRS